MSPNNLLKDPRRKRTPLEERFLKYGLEDFSDSEMIELLLCHVQTRKEGKKLANEINRRYKTLREFLTTPVQELEQIPGMTPRIILCIRLMREMPIVFLQEGVIKKPAYKSPQEVLDYLYYSMRDLKKEVFKIAWSQ